MVIVRLAVYGLILSRKNLCEPGDPVSCGTRGDSESWCTLLYVTGSRQHSVAFAPKSTSALCVSVLLALLH